MAGVGGIHKKDGLEGEHLAEGGHDGGIRGGGDIDIRFRRIGRHEWRSGQSDGSGYALAIPSGGRGGLRDPGDLGAHDPTMGARHLGPQLERQDSIERRP